MDIRNIGIIVDGPTEKDSLENMFYKVYHKTPVIRYGPGNGLQYTEECYAKKVVPLIVFLLSGNVYSLILIPDLEKREKKNRITLIQFAKKMKECVVADIVKTGLFHEDYLNGVINVCPSNIMFENWILSDVEGIKASKLINDDAEQDYYDGRNGASLLNDMMVDKSYKKTRDAQNLFKYVDSEIGKGFSRSFNEFMRVFDELLNK
ncbi:MAG: hypothetical protein J6Y82_11980 [Bacteroidales bacterium]|nr:hypothetical protein [Bacteroidales bacterium]